MKVFGFDVVLINLLEQKVDEAESDEGSEVGKTPVQAVQNGTHPLALALIMRAQQGDALGDRSGRKTTTFKRRRTDPRIG